MADTVVPGHALRGRDPQEAPTLIGEVVDGRFRVTAKVARGGMGVVYRAHDLTTQTEVALKVLHPALCQDTELVDRFLQEARAASSIGHPSIVRVIESGTVDGGGPVYYAMEYLHGEDMARILRRRKRLPWKRTRMYALQIVQALQASHNAGIIHRDLKPANFFVIRDRGTDRVKLLDFGIAKISESSGIEAVVQTHGGSVFGTPAYMSPEQASGEEVDPRTDIYAIAACLYEFLTGHPPYDGANFMQVLSRVLTQPLLAPSIRSPDNVPPEVEELILKGMSKDPSQRFQSMTELGEALLGIDPEAQPQIRESGNAPPSQPVVSLTDDVPEPPPFDFDTAPDGDGEELVLETRPPLPSDGLPPDVPPPMAKSGDTGKAPRDDLLTSADDHASKGSFVGTLEFEEDPQDLNPRPGDTLVASDFAPPGSRSGDTMVAPIENVPGRRRRQNTQITPIHMLPGRAKALDYNPAAVAKSAASSQFTDEPSDPGMALPTRPPPQSPPPAHASATGPHAIVHMDAAPTDPGDLGPISELDDPPAPRSPLRYLAWAAGAVLCVAAGGAAMMFGPSAMDSWSTQDNSVEATAPASTEPAVVVAPDVEADEPDEPDAAAEDAEPEPTPPEATAAEDAEPEVFEEAPPKAAPEPEAAPAEPARPAPAKPRSKNRRKRKRDTRTKPSAPTKSGPTYALGRAQISNGFRSADATVRSTCGTHNGARVRIKVIVGNDGRVRSATVQSAPDGGVGRCVAAAVRRSAKFPAFKKATDTFLWTYRL